MQDEFETPAFAWNGLPNRDLHLRKVLFLYFYGDDLLGRSAFVGICINRFFRRLVLRLRFFNDLNRYAMHLRFTNREVELNLDVALRAYACICRALEVATNTSLPHLSGAGVLHNMGQHLD